MYSRSLWWGSTYTTHGEDKNEYMVFLCVPDVSWVSLGGPVPTQYTKKTKIITWLKLCARCVLGSWRASPHSTQRIHNQFVMNTWICMPDMFCFSFLMGQHTQHTQMHDFLWAQNVSQWLFWCTNTYTTHKEHPLNTHWVHNFLCVQDVF